MGIGWERDKREADVFTPTIKAVLGRLFIGEAPVKEDQEQATDLMVFTIAPLTVACRMRRKSYVYSEAFRNEFTIRCTRPSGVQVGVGQARRRLGRLHVLWLWRLQHRPNSSVHSD